MRRIGLALAALLTAAPVYASLTLLGTGRQGTFVDAPTLSALTVTPVDDATDDKASLELTTDTAEGDVFAVAVLDGATAPNAAQIEAGTDGVGGAAEDAVSVAVSTIGSQSLGFVNLTSGTDHTGYTVQKDDESDYSNVVSDDFTTTGTAPSGFSPDDLFLASEKGYFINPDVGIVDSSPNAVPLTLIGSPTVVSNYISLNGTSQAFRSTSAIDFSGTDKITIIAGIRNNNAATGTLLETYVDYGTILGGVGVFTRVLVDGDIYVGAFRERNGAYGTPTNAIPYDEVVTIEIDIAGANKADELKIRVNGVAPSLTSGGDPSNIGTGNLANTIHYIGARAGNSFFFKDRIYGILVIGRLLDSTERDNAEDWMAARAGVTLP